MSNLDAMSGPDAPARLGAVLAIGFLGGTIAGAILLAQGGGWIAALAAYSGGGVVSALAAAGSALLRRRECEESPTVGASARG